jgi:hypothetical protein
LTDTNEQYHEYLDFIQEMSELDNSADLVRILIENPEKRRILVEAFQAIEDRTLEDPLVSAQKNPAVDRVQWSLSFLNQTEIIE